jgi:hypothetical protein
MYVSTLSSATRARTADVGSAENQYKVTLLPDSAGWLGGWAIHSIEIAAEECVQ